MKAEQELKKDAVTGLVWEAKTNKDGFVNYSDPHDADNKYALIGSDSGSYGVEVDSFLKALNDSRFGGHADWRLPELGELATLVDYEISEPGPASDSDYFWDTVPSFYWSRTSMIIPCSSTRGTVWGVDFDKGTLSSGYFLLANHVRAVRGEYAGSSFHDNENGTVTDKATGLMWQQQGPSAKMNWEQSLSYCEGLNLGGYTDWRLPTIRELLRLMDYDKCCPAINAYLFPDADPISAYWSSTVDTNKIGFAKAVSSN